MESNYEKQVYMARELFKQYDRKTMIRKFELEHDEEYLYLQLLDQKYRVRLETGEVERQRADAGEQSHQEERETQGAYEPCIDYRAVMTIYDVLCCSGEHPVRSGVWCPLHALQVTMSSPSADLSTAKCARLFAGKPEKLAEVCRRIGGVQPQLRAGADVCWEFSVFPFFPVQLRFWDRDEEFDAKIQLLWDHNSLDFMHFETLYYVMGILMQRLEDMDQ